MTSKTKFLTFGLFLSLILILLSVGSCSKILGSKKIKQGKIVYDITYETTKNENPLVVLLPKQMTTFFADNNTLTIIEGFFGTFKMMLLSRPDLDKKYAIVRILDKRYIYETSLDGYPLGYDDMKDLKIWFVDSSFTYKNLQCKLAKGYCPTISKDTFDIYYTNDIQIQDPNVNTPFTKIPGVIVKSKMKLFNVVMDIELNKLTNTQVDKNIFQVPKKSYKYISRTELEKIIKSFEE